MSHFLVIVESPAKVRTIKKFLGSQYTVMASNGHVRDLPKSQMGVDVEKDYEPRYITIRGKGELLAGLRKEVKKADKIYLATDPDREGEAISWHLMVALKLEDKKVYRISFNEITKNAVKGALKNARPIDMNLVDAQQARRVLDRVVGYKISPILWGKVKRGLSAGRVQSVALRIIADREEEINAFQPEEYWNLQVLLSLGSSDKVIPAAFFGDEKGKLKIRSESEVRRIVEEIEDQEFVVREIKKSERMRKAPIVFTTSTMQQEAFKSLNFPTARTMRIAQQLYEGIDIKGNGTVGLITYLRTDSTRVSEEADEKVRKYIEESYGLTYVSKGDKKNVSERKIQDAHEAIRPTDVALTPVKIKESLSRDQFRLYQLIWKRFVASRMQPVRYQNISVRIGAGKYLFIMSSSKTLFDGFHIIYREADEEKEESGQIFSGIECGAKLNRIKCEYTRNFTQPPAHYTEAALVKTLEELGIGRPSTYAPTISTIISRHYVVKEDKHLYMSELGEVVNHMVKETFPQVVDVNFTANMEKKLDNVAEGKMRWKSIIEDVYPELDEAVEKAQKELEKVVVADEVTDEICDQCGRNMVIKYGPHGKFLACPGFPECRNTKTYLEKTGAKCPECGKDIVVRKSKKGRRFYSCEDSQNCKYMSWQKPKIDEKKIKEKERKK